MGKDAANSSGRGHPAKEMEMAWPYAKQTTEMHWSSSPELEHLAAGA